MRLLNKVAIVTGAAGGIGQAIIEKLTSEGAKVVAVDISAEALKVFDGYGSEKCTRWLLM